MKIVLHQTEGATEMEYWIDNFRNVNKLTDTDIVSENLTYENSHFTYVVCYKPQVVSYLIYDDD